MRNDNIPTPRELAEQISRQEKAVDRVIEFCLKGITMDYVKDKPMVLSFPDVPFNDAVTAEVVLRFRLKGWYVEATKVKGYHYLTFAGSFSAT